MSNKKHKLFKNLQKQFLRFGALSCGCSVAIMFIKTFLNFFRLNSSYTAVSLITLAITTVFFYLWLRDYRMGNQGIKRYYATNLVAMGCLCAIGIVISVIPVTKQLSYWLFFHFSFFKYLLVNMQFKRIYSLLLVSAYYMILVAIVPLLTQKHRTLKNQKTRKSHHTYLLRTESFSETNSHHHRHSHHHSDTESTDAEKKN